MLLDLFLIKGIIILVLLVDRNVGCVDNVYIDGIVIGKCIYVVYLL